MTLHPGQFLGLPPCPADEADAVVLPLPYERTVSYGRGTGRAPQALLEATTQIETFDEETGADFERAPRVHTAAPLAGDEPPDEYVRRVAEAVRAFDGKFVLGLGGEHTVTYGVACGAARDPQRTTIVQLDAHADLIGELEGARWSHGTVMRRLHERGFRIVQLGVRSLSREEYDLISAGGRITTFYAHELPARWAEALAMLRGLTGDVYLTLDADALDPSVLPSVGTPQPDGLTWRQTMEVFRALTSLRRGTLIAADFVEFVPSPHPPGCDLAAAKLPFKLLAYRQQARLQP